MLKIFGTNMSYISIKSCLILPLLLYSEDFALPFALSTVVDKKVEQNLSLEQINREISNNFSIDKNSTDYKYEDIVKLHNRLDEYLDASNAYNHPRYIDNSTILVSSNTTNTSEITNKIERINSTIKNSNIGVVIEQDIHNSVIENEVSVINSNINNSNLGVEIKDSNRRDNHQNESFRNVILKSSIKEKDSVSIKSNDGISIGNN
jgi:hypothetical protein